MQPSLFSSDSDAAWREALRQQTECEDPTDDMVWADTNNEYPQEPVDFNNVPMTRPTALPNALETNAQDLNADFFFDQPQMNLDPSLLADGNQAVSSAGPQPYTQSGMAPQWQAGFVPYSTGLQTQPVPATMGQAPGWYQPSNPQAYRQDGMAGQGQNEHIPYNKGPQQQQQAVPATVGQAPGWYESPPACQPTAYPTNGVVSAWPPQVSRPPPPFQPVQLSTISTEGFLTNGQYPQQGLTGHAYPLPFNAMPSGPSVMAVPAAQQPPGPVINGIKLRHHGFIVTRPPLYNKDYPSADEWESRAWQDENFCDTRGVMKAETNAQRAFIAHNMNLGNKELTSALL